MVKNIHTHYDNLKVARNASDQVIRAAYKTLCNLYHPDKNSGDAEAGKIMSIINVSYRVLSDPEKRNSHDAWIARMEMHSENEAEINSAIYKPSPCDGGRKMHSYPGTTNYSPYQETQDKPAPKFLDVLFILGRWGLMAVVGLVVILTLSFLLYKAYHKVTSPFSTASRNFNDSRLQGRQSVEGDDYDGTRTPPIYKYDSTPSSFSPSVSKGGSNLSSQAIQSSGSRSTDVTKKSGVGNSTSTATQSKKYSRPDKAPNGSPWPSRASYISGYAKNNLGGLSTVKVDNSKNNSSVFVKLYSVSYARTYPARAIYIPAGSAFKVESISAGQYEIRYQDLRNGGFYKSEVFSLSEKSTSAGVSYSNVTMTLYKVQGGNMSTYPISEEEF